MMAGGAGWAVSHGYGSAEDLRYIESDGCLPGAQPEHVSERAIARGRAQLGTLGSGNHFAEIQIVDEIFDQECAAAFGLYPDQVTVSIHSGSRGLGYQVWIGSSVVLLCSLPRPNATSGPWLRPPTMPSPTGSS